MHAGLNIELHADLHPGESATSSLEAQVVWYSDCCGLRGFSAPRAVSRAFARLKYSSCQWVVLFCFRLFLLTETYYSANTTVSVNKKVEHATDLSHILSVIRGLTEKKLRPKVRNKPAVCPPGIHPSVHVHRFICTCQVPETAQHNLMICRVQSF